MALGTTTAAAVAIADRSEVSRPCQLTSFWQVINDDAKSQDNSGTPNPYSDSLSSTPVIMTIPYGTTLRLAARYTDSGSMSTDPVVQVFGRSVNPAGQQDNTETTNTGTVGAWQQIVNKAGDLDITLSDASTDISDGSTLFQTWTLTVLILTAITRFWFWSKPQPLVQPMLIFSVRSSDE